MSELDAIFTGLPGSGKTSYLALLYQAIVAHKAGTFRLSSYGDDDRVFINQISARLLSGQEAIHTEEYDRDEVTLSLTADAQAFRLRVPDLGGEVFDNALADRRWTRELDDRIQAATGYLVFVHAVDIEVGMTIAQVKNAQALFNDAEDEDATKFETDDAAEGSTIASTGGDDPAADRSVSNWPPADGTGGDAVPATPALRPRQTQVALVDLIQLLEKRRRTDPVRLSVVVSAWDMVRTVVAPAKWLHTTCPLLEQYLRHNRATINSRLWGVSAQGGRFDIVRSRDLLLQEDAVDRAICVNSTGAPAGVHGPLAWALTLG